MKSIDLFLRVIFTALCIFASMAGAEELSCECPKLGCDPCSREHGVKFYTEKCGSENSRVRSCARPSCEPIDQATEQCPVPPQAHSGLREPVVVKAAAEDVKDAEAKDVTAVGRVKVIHGSVSIIRADGQKTVVTKEADVHETDTLESSADGGAVVSFNGGNKLHVHPETSVEVKEFKDSQIEASRRALLHLIKGKIRNQVEQKYNGKTSYYRIETRAAVAGVRGTDFVVEYSQNGKIETKVEALKGKVTLSSLDQKQSREITRGEGAKFNADFRAGASEEEITETIRHGSLSPVYKVNDEQLQELDRTSRIDVARRDTPKESAICEKPKGLFNQCVWRCVGNPASSTKCRVDLPAVKCLRQRCNGNGEWAEETQLPPRAAHILCPATGASVKACDY